MRGSSSIGRITRSLLRVTGAVALLVSLVGATTLLAGVTSGSAQHAARHLATYHSSKPTVSVDALNSPSYNPYPYLTSPSMDVSGQGFTPGDLLHLQFIAGDGPNAGSVLAEGDTTASLDAYLPQGDGQDILVPGGEFGIGLTPSLAAPLLCQAMTHAVLTVVDPATRESASTYVVDISRWGCVPPPPSKATVSLYNNYRFVNAGGINFEHPNVDVSGQGFTPGDPLHLQLISTAGPNTGLVLAEGDFTASLDRYLYQGDGQYVLVPGGELITRIYHTSKLPLPLTCPWEDSVAVTVVDTATGQSASSNSVKIWGWC